MISRTPFHSSPCRQASFFVRQREGSAVHAARREVVRVEMREGKVLERHEHHLRDLGPA